LLNKSGLCLINFLINIYYIRYQCHICSNHIPELTVKTQDVAEYAETHMVLLENMIYYYAEDVSEKTQQI